MNQKELKGRVIALTPILPIVKYFTSYFLVVLSTITIILS